MSRRLLTLSFVLGAFALAGADDAGAANFCVGASSDCTGSPQSPFSQDAAGIAGAVSAANANPGADNIFLAAGTYTLGSALNPSFAASQDVHIIGAGVESTVFAGSIASATLVTLNFPTAAGDARGFTVRVTGTPTSATGLQVTKGAVSNVFIDQPNGNALGFRGLALDAGAAASDSFVSTTSASATALAFDTTIAVNDDGNGSATRMLLDGQAGGSSGILIDSNTGSHPLDRMVVRGFFNGVFVPTGSFALTDSVVDMLDYSVARGVYAHRDSGSASIFASLARDTIVGSGTSQVALTVGATGTQDFTGDFSDLVLFASGTSALGIKCIGGSSQPNASSLDSFAIRGADIRDVDCGMISTGKVDLASTDPGFRSLATGDYRLKAGSPLIDHGKAGESISPSERDLDGAARVVDGDGNGSATVDLGAYEYQRGAPSVAISGDPTTGELGVGDTFGFSATAEDPDSDEVTFKWTFDDGGTATGPHAKHVFATAGIHSVTLLGADAAGATGSATTTVRVTPLAAAKLVAKPRRAFKRGRKKFSIAKPGQTNFSVKFTDASIARFTLQQLRKGRKPKAVKGSSTLAVKDGTVKFFFGGGNLKAGSYRVTITPLWSTGRAGTPATVVIKVK